MNMKYKQQLEANKMRPIELKELNESNNLLLEKRRKLKQQQKQQEQKKFERQASKPVFQKQTSRTSHPFEFFKRQKSKVEN